MISGYVIYPNHVSPAAAAACLHRQMREVLASRTHVTPELLLATPLIPVVAHPITDEHGVKFTAHLYRLDTAPGTNARFVMAYGVEMIGSLTASFEDVVLEASSQVMSYVAKDIGLNLFTKGPEQAVIDAVTACLLYVDSPTCELRLGDYHATCVVTGL